MLLFAGPVTAQQLSNLRSKPVTAADSITLDTLSIAYGSAEIFAGPNRLDTGYYRIDEMSSVIRFNMQRLAAEGIDPARVTVNYRVLPFKFTSETKDESKHFLLRNRLPSTDPSRRYPLIYDLNLQPEPVNDFRFDGLTKSGSLTRGIAFGNAQDASVISSFNLQLSGKINNDIDIIAAITDENIPIQPEGNTQTLQDFDRIFIQLSKGSTKVIGGDYFITKPAGYFMNMYKRAQGLSISTGFPNSNIFRRDEPGSMRLGLSGAVARGKFRRQPFMGIEGNQGPYRLTGNDGETFIIVLSGSESIFIDGKKMERGQENDYIIDYNTAEVTFTAKRIITKDVRIIIEFEYSDRNYQRWMVHANNEWEYGNFYYRANFFMELDDKNAPLNQQLTDAEKQALALAGDSLQNAIAPSVDSVGFNTNEILYRRIDTLVNGNAYVVYAYSTNPDSAKFRISFSNAGPGNGDYLLENSLANGKVYRWIAPNADGTHNGQFAPVTRLVAPKTQYMATLATGYRFSRNFSIDTEGALSLYDLNSFSSIGSKNDLGYAFKVDLNYRGNLRKIKNDTLVMTANVSYEQVEQTFRPFIRFRSVEFERDWNLVNTNNPNSYYQNTVSGNDHIGGLLLGISQKSWGRFSYQFQGYLKGETYKAFRNSIALNFSKKRWTADITGSQTSTFDTAVATLFVRQQSHFQRKFGVLAAGINGQTEYNAFRSAATGVLQGNSYMFNDWEAFIGNGDSAKFTWRIFYKVRIDHLPSANEFRMAAIAHHAGGSFDLLHIRNQLLRTTITYRNLQITDTLLLKQPDESSLLARIEYTGKFLDDAININLFYEIGSGLENKRDYQFVQSLNGLGTHVWIDYNSNGVKERDEYEIRTGTIVGTDGFTYIKYFIPTTEFIRTYYNQLTASLNLKAPEKWKKTGGFKKLLTKLSSQTVFRTDQKTQKDDFLSSLNPFSLNTLDTALLAMNYSFRQSLYINRFGSKFGIELNYQDVRSKVLLSNGIDTRINEYGNARVRYNITRMITVNLEGRYGNKISNSQFLRSRDYSIRYWEIKPEIVFQPGVKFRVTGTYKFSRKNNAGTAGDTVNTGGQEATIHDAGLDFKTSFLLKGQFQLRVNYILIRYDATENNALAFEMLEGLTTGNNVTWGASFQRTIGSNLQVSVNYDGRKSEGKEFIHIASMQVRAFF